MEPMGGLTFNNCFSIEQEDVPAFVVAGSGNPRGEGGRPGWSDITGHVTASNPFGARVDVRTPVQDFTLTMNGQPVRPRGNDVNDERSTSSVHVLDRKKN